MPLQVRVKGTWQVTYQNLPGSPTQCVTLYGPFGAASEPTDQGQALGQYVTEGLGKIFGCPITMDIKDCRVTRCDSSAQAITVVLTDEYIAKLTA